MDLDRHDFEFGGQRRRRNAVHRDLGFRDRFSSAGQQSAAARGREVEPPPSKHADPPVLDDQAGR